MTTYDPAGNAGPEGVDYTAGPSTPPTPTRPWYCPEDPALCPTADCTDYGSPDTCATREDRKPNAARDLFDTLRAVFADPDAEVNGADLVEFIGEVVAEDWDPETQDALSLARFYALGALADDEPPADPEDRIADHYDELMAHAEAAYDNEYLHHADAREVAAMRPHLDAIADLTCVLLRTSPNPSATRAYAARAAYLEHLARGMYPEAWRDAMDAVDHYAEARAYETEVRNRA